MDSALKDAAELIQMNEANPRAHFYMGKILQKQGQDNEAVLHFE
jgi:hypothetical protein